MRVALLAAVVVLVAAAAAAAAPRPALRALDSEPLVLRGSGFRAGEQVVVRAATRAGAVSVRRARASRTGGFTVRFAQSFDACTGIVLARATGARSGTVTLRPNPRHCVEIAP